jgi:hypothetical protein
MAGGAAFVVNFMFRRDAGYFDSQLDTKPLLHLWSPISLMPNLSTQQKNPEA